MIFRSFRPLPYGYFVKLDEYIRRIMAEGPSRTRIRDSFSLKQRNPDSYTWAAGSYIDLFIAAAVTQVLFGISLYWILFVDTTLVTDRLPGGATLDASNLPMLAIGMLAGVGWMMAIALGIGFDITPLNFKAAPFDESLISIVAALNIGGQALIMVGIISGDLQLFRNLGLMGVTLLGMQLIILGPLTVKLVRGRAQSKDNLGPWSYGAGVGLPIIGVMSMMVWLLAESEQFVELYWTILIDSFWGMLAFGTILGHFQSRLGWKLMKPERMHMAFKGFIALCILHICLVYANQTGYIVDDRVNATFSLPILWIFFVSRPDRIWKNFRAGRKCSNQMLSAYCWLLVTALVGLYEGLYHGEQTGMFYARFMLLLGVSTQALTAAGDWLHDDHKHKPVEERKEPWFNLIAISLAMVGVVYLFLGSTVEGLSLPAIETVTLLTVAMLIVVYLEFLIWMLRETLFGYTEWHRIPMFYADVDSQEGDDPYEIGATESE